MAETTMRSINYKYGLENNPTVSIVSKSNYMAIFHYMREFLLLVLWPTRLFPERNWNPIFLDLHFILTVCKYKVGTPRT